MKTANHIPHSKFRDRRSAFTLVEMLVVIAIIGMLAALIIPAVMAGIDAAKRGAIVAEISGLDTAMKQYKNTYGSFPPNFSDPAAVVRHLKKAFPRIAGSELALVDSNPDGASLFELNPAEAIPFWLGGFSNDPEFPLTGQGGPLFVPLIAADREYDEHGDGIVNLDARTPLFEMDKSRLEEGPTGHIEIADPAGGGVIEVVLYQYRPTNLEEPYVYFDTSRGKFDLVGTADYVEAIDWPYYKSSIGNGIVRALVIAGTKDFVNPDSFQILAAGTDDTWSLEDPSDAVEWSRNWTVEPDAADQVQDPDVNIVIGRPKSFPAGPYTGDMADNLSNFATGAFEDAGEN